MSKTIHDPETDGIEEYCPTCGILIARCDFEKCKVYATYGENGMRINPIMFSGMLQNCKAYKDTGEFHGFQAQWVKFKTCGSCLASSNRQMDKLIRGKHKPFDESNGE